MHFGLLAFSLLFYDPDYGFALQTTPLVFIRDFNKHEQLLLTQFKETALWNDPRQRERLLEQLAVAKVMRCPSFAPLLANHIAFDRVSPRDTTKEPLSPETRYPVFAVLQGIGIVAVPCLISEMATLEVPTDTATSPEETKRELLFLCLLDAYEPGGKAKEMLALRLESEIKNRSGREKELLLKALEHPLLRKK